ncbi:MAG: phage capsid protein [Pseudomonadota bacterium]
MKLNLNNLLYNIVVCLLLTVVVTNSFGAVPGILAGAGLFAVGACLPAKPAAVQSPFAFMAIAKEIWLTDLNENVFPENGFINKSIDDSEGLSGKIVHAPEAGGVPTVQKNRTVFPAVATRRTDTTADYTIDEFTTDPSHVTVTEQIEASYQKRVSLLFNHYNQLKTQTSISMLYNWAPTTGANIFRSTGASRSPYMGSQTGNRLKVAKEDFANAARLLDRMDVPREGRVALVPADLAMDLMLIPEFVSANIFGQGAQKEGVLGRVFGFDIMTRSTSILYTSAGAPKDPAAGAAAGDGQSIIFWHPMYVRKAIGTRTNGGIDIFEDNASPLYYGDVMSTMVRSGGRIVRTDQRGVVVMVEGIA